MTGSASAASTWGGTGVGPGVSRYCFSAIRLEPSGACGRLRLGPVTHLCQMAPGLLTHRTGDRLTHLNNLLPRLRHSHVAADPGRSLDEGQTHNRTRVR